MLGIYPSQWGGQALPQAAQRGCGFVIPGATRDLPVEDPEQPHVASLCFEQGLDQIESQNSLGWGCESLSVQKYFSLQ